MPVLLWLLMVACAAAGSSRPEPFSPAQHPEYQPQGGTPPTWLLLEPRAYRHDELLGYLPSGSVHRVLRTTDAVVYDVRMSFDTQGYRVTPQARPERRRRFLAFLGGSSVVGTGLADDETLPAFVAAELPDFHVYNLAISGSGPNTTLAQAEDPRLDGIIKEKSGLFVYVAEDMHIERACGFVQELSWTGSTPFYSYDSQGKLYRDGTLAKAYPLRMVLLRLMNLAWGDASRFPFDWPKRSEEHERYACDLIATAAERLTARYPGSRFVVAMHPASPLRPSVRDCLRSKHVVMLEPDVPPGAANAIPIDGHPNELMNHRLARSLVTTYPDLFK